IEASTAADFLPVSNRKPPACAVSVSWYLSFSPFQVPSAKTTMGSLAISAAMAAGEGGATGTTAGAAAGAVTGGGAGDAPGRFLYRCAACCADADGAVG